MFGDVHHHHFAATVIGHVVSLDVHPRLVIVRMRAAIHAGEEHVLRVFIFDAAGDFHVAVLLVGRGFLLTDELGSLAGDARLAIAVGCRVEGHLRRKGLPIEQRARAILFTSQVFAQGEDVFRRVLVHRRIGRGADDDECVGRVAHHDEQRAQQSGVQRAGADAEFLFQRSLCLRAQVEPQQGDDNEADDDGTHAVSVERNAQQGDAQDERQGHALLVAVLVGLVHAPNEHGGQHEDIDQHARVERHTQGIDKQQLEPSAHLHDARHHAIEDHSHQHRRT